MLHIISSSPFVSSALRECLAVAQPGDTLLLLADAVYATNLDPNSFNELNLNVLDGHAKARGLPRVAWASYVDYDGMAALAEQLHPIQTWH